MKVSVNWALCDGNGICTVEAPDVFELDDSDNLVLLTETTDDSRRSAVEAAVRSCPKRALTIESE